MSKTRISGTVALVTGANRGIGRAITEALLERGAEKVYAAARKSEALADLRESYGDRVVPLELDVTDTDQVLRPSRRPATFVCWSTMQAWRWVAS